MKAMIFAAGLGTRLKPLTDDRPKAMVEVNGKPLIQHIIEKLTANGFDEIIVNVHHFAEQIIDFLLENNNFGIRIEISDERGMLLETGGGIKKAAHFFDDGKPFLVHNVDIFSNADLRELYNHHIESGSAATLLVSNRKSSRNLLFNDDMRLCGWQNKTTGETKPKDENIDASKFKHLAFSGIHIFSPSLFAEMEKWDGKFSIIDFYLSAMKSNKIIGYEHDDLKLIDVGKIENLKQASDFLKGIASSTLL